MKKISRYDKDCGFEEILVFEQHEIRALQMAGVPDDDIVRLSPEFCSQEELDRRFGTGTFERYEKKKSQARMQLARLWCQDTEDALTSIIRENSSIYWVETSATLSRVFMRCGAIPVPSSMVKYLLNENIPSKYDVRYENVTPACDGIRYIHPSQETPNLGAWKTLFLLPSLSVYEAAYKTVGGMEEYKVTNAKDADSVITQIYSNIFEDQTYEVFPKWKDAVLTASWYLESRENRTLDASRKAVLLNEVKYYLQGDYADLNIHTVSRKYLNIVEDEYGVIFDETKKRIVDINKERFNHCHSYTVPPTTEYIDNDVFYCNENLHHIDLSNVRFIGDNQFLQTGLRELVVPATVESLGACVCEGCKSLERVEFKGSLDYLHIASFNGCSKLREIRLPKGLTGLSDNVFSGTSSLESLELEEGLHSIADECFSGSGLKSLTLPSTVMDVSPDAFAGKEDIQLSIKYTPNYRNLPQSMLSSMPMPSWMYIETFLQCWIFQLLKHFAYIVEVKSTGRRSEELDYYQDQLMDCLKWLNAIEIEADFPYYTLTTARTTADTDQYDLVYLFLAVSHAMDLEDWAVSTKDKLALAMMFRSQLPEMYKLIEDGTAKDINKYVNALDHFLQLEDDDIQSFIEQCNEHLSLNPVDPSLLQERQSPSEEVLRQMELRYSPVRIPLTRVWIDGPSITTTHGDMEEIIVAF